MNKTIPVDVNVRKTQKTKEQKPLVRLNQVKHVLKDIDTKQVHCELCKSIHPNTQIGSFHNSIVCGDQLSSIPQSNTENTKKWCYRTRASG